MINFNTKWIARSLFTHLIVLSGLCVFQNASHAENLSDSHQYPEAEQQAYLSACQQVTVEQGFSQQQAQNLCVCTLDQFKTKYSLEQFRELYKAANQNNEVPSEFIKAGIFCAARLSLK
ncbi:MAG: hypothetical protein WBA77_20785 [Microcoleaceae cyanobacterium]